MSETDETPQIEPDPVLVERLSEEDYSLYLEDRKRLFALVETGGQFYHKWLLGISGGALAVSMTFVKDVIKPESATETVALVAAWCILAAVMALILVNELLGYNAAVRFVAILDSEAGAGGRDFLTRAHNRQIILLAPRFALWIDYLCLALFLAGLICLAYFVKINF